MNFASLKGRIKKAGFYLPFTIYFVVFVLAAIVAWRWLRTGGLQDDTAFGSILGLLLQVALVFVAVMLSLALLSVLASIFYFSYYKRKNAVSISLDTDLQTGELRQKQAVRLRIAPLFKPPFGFVNMRLQYDHDLFSEKFTLVETGSRQLFRKAIDGTYYWPLPQIKEYKISKAIVYFEDVFQFFSMATDVPVKSNFFTHPTARPVGEMNVAPRKTEDTSTRIDELRKVEGEFLNYKNFENNDDVRRIVWKIYAKNKELVVRIPEIMDPYASHIYLYVSFFSTFNVAGNEVAEVPFLNYYKVMAWTVYQKLVKKGFEVKYIPDQEVSRNNMADEQHAVKYQVSTSKWQYQHPLKDFVRTKDASVVLVSSLSDADEVQQLAEQHGNDISFIFIRLTDGLRKQNFIDWVQWLFVHNEKNDLDIYRRAWTVSALRKKLLANERALEEIMHKYVDQVTVQ